MSDRAKALATLREAREALIDRIAEMVNGREDFTDEIVDAWSSAAEEILDLGERLRRLTQVIDGMPLMHIESPYQPATFGDFTNPALGQPFEELPTWDDFLYEIDNALLISATSTLVSLTQMDPVIARQAVNVFSEQWDDTEFRAKAKSLRAQLSASLNGSLKLIQELFGIGEDLATQAYHSLRVSV